MSNVSRHQMPYTADDFAYGPVVVLRGKHKGRIGEFDDDTTERGRLCAVVMFAPFGIASGSYFIPVTYLRRPNTKDLLLRYEELWRKLTLYLKDPLEGEERIEALEEMAYVSSLLDDRMFKAQFMREHDGAKIFLSHSSLDKAFVRGLAVDLSELGHRPWLDEWEILGGDSIPSEVARGLDDSDFVVVVLSENAVRSQWVQKEWEAKYWDEINSRRISVIPLLLSDCKIPTLLKTKKYIDFRHDYTAAVEDLARTLSGHIHAKSSGG